MGKTGGGTGTNQYQIRGSSRAADMAIPPVAHLMDQAAGPQVRCGQVWGTGCNARVAAPTWRHGTHGGISHLPSPDLPEATLRHLWDSLAIKRITGDTLAKILRMRPRPEICDSHLPLISSCINELPADVWSDADLAIQMIPAINWVTVTDIERIKPVLEHPSPSVRHFIAKRAFGPALDYLAEKALQDQQLRRVLLVDNTRLLQARWLVPLVNKPDVLEYVGRLPSNTLRHLSEDKIVSSYRCFSSLQFGRKLAAAGRVRHVADQFIQDHIVPMKPEPWANRGLNSMGAQLTQMVGDDRDKLELLADRGCQQAALHAMELYTDISADHLARWFAFDPTDKTVRTNMLAQQHAPEQLFRWVYAHPKESELRQAAVHPKLPPDLLDKLWYRAQRFPDNRVLWGLVRNPALSAEQLQPFYTHHSPGVRQRALDHPNCPPQVRALASLI